MNILRRKSLDTAIQDINQSSKLERHFGLLQLVLMGIGAIIGAGIFVLTGAAANQAAGPAVILSFALSGVVCMCAGLCYAELSSFLPGSGGPYTYSYVIFGELFAWLIASCIIVGNTFIIASVANGWSGYVTSFLRDFGISIPAALSATPGTILSGTFRCEEITGIFNLPAALIVIALNIMLYLGTQTSAFLNSIIVFIKMSVLAAFILIGFFYIDPNNWVPFVPQNAGVFGKFGWSGVFGGAAMIFISYNGFDTVATAAQETKNPGRNVPLGIIISILVCAITYILCSSVLTGIVNYTRLNVSEPIALAVEYMKMPWFSLVIKAGAVAGLSSVILVMSFSITRVLFAVTEDGLLPKIFSKVHPKFNTPYVATVLLGSVSALCAGLVPLNYLIQLGNFCILVVSGTMCFATICFRYQNRKNRKNDEGKFYCPGMPWVPVLGILLIIQILSGMPDKAVYFYFAKLIMCSIVVYFIFGFRNSPMRLKNVR